MLSIILFYLFHANKFYRHLITVRLEVEGGRFLRELAPPVLQRPRPREAALLLGPLVPGPGSLGRVALH